MVKDTMTREEMKAKVRRLASCPPWTEERLAGELNRIDGLKVGTRVCFEDTYCGLPQGLTFGDAWEEKAGSSGRVHWIGVVAE